MEAALRSRLLAVPALAAITTSIAWVLRIQGAPLPGITMQKVVSGASYSFAGRVRFQGDTVQFDLWAETFAQAIALRDLVIAEMERAATLDGVEFTPAFIAAERQSSEDVPGKTPIARISLDVLVWWNFLVP